MNQRIEYYQKTGSLSHRLTCLAGKIPQFLLLISGWSELWDSDWPLIGIYSYHEKEARTNLFAFPFRSRETT
jgi:hypothetical protein|tara:strand:+ start:374 stop:589 length:216 start_codon:yes stop_codon:yes gene_type:complete